MPSANWPVASVPEFLAGLSESTNGRLFVLTGGRQGGKTRFCLELASQASVQGLQVAGLVSPAVFEGREKIGIDLLDLATREKRRLALRRQPPATDPDARRWQLDESVLQWGNAVLTAIGACHLLILDELGPLELLDGRGLSQGLELIGARRYSVACLVIRPSLLTAALELWPWAEVFQVNGEMP
jgi:nucleoside-triphosphatase THEP1